MAWKWSLTLKINEIRLHFIEESELRSSHVELFTFLPEMCIRWRFSNRCPHQKRSNHPKTTPTWLSKGADQVWILPYLLAVCFQLIELLSLLANELDRFLHCYLQTDAWFSINNSCPIHVWLLLFFFDRIRQNTIDFGRLLIVIFSPWNSLDRPATRRSSAWIDSIWIILIN